MSFVMKEDKTLDPANVGFFGLGAIVPHVDCVTDLIEQLRLLCGWKADRSNSSGASSGMGGRTRRYLSVGFAIGVFLDQITEDYR
jgi:hypothetical protein